MSPFDQQRRVMGVRGSIMRAWYTCKGNYMWQVYTSYGVLVSVAHLHVDGDMHDHTW